MATTTTTTNIPEKKETMKYVNLGKTGLKVSRICLGMMTYGTPNWGKWILTEEQSMPIIQRAFDLGINFYDTANMYSTGVSEEILGKAVKKFSSRRDDVVIASKVFFPMGDNPNNKGLSRKHIMQSIDDSLKRLDTNYIDLYQIHRWDPHTPIRETMEALHDLVRIGKVRYLGASSMYCWQFQKAQNEAQYRGLTQFVSMQNHYNLIYREDEREMIPYCNSEGIGLLPWSPLARGFLTGSRNNDRKGETVRSQTDKYSSVLYTDPNDFEISKRLEELAQKKKTSQAKIALSWMLHKPGVVSPIIGASKMEHLEEAVGSLDISLSPEEINFLEENYKPHKISGHN